MASSGFALWARSVQFQHAVPHGSLLPILRRRGRGVDGPLHTMNPLGGKSSALVAAQAPDLLVYGCKNPIRLSFTPLHPRSTSADQNRSERLKNGPVIAGHGCVPNGKVAVSTSSGGRRIETQPDRGRRSSTAERVPPYEPWGQSVQPASRCHLRAGAYFVSVDRLGRRDQGLRSQTVTSIRRPAEPRSSYSLDANLL